MLKTQNKKCQQPQMETNVGVGHNGKQKCERLLFGFDVKALNANYKAHIHQHTHTNTHTHIYIHIYLTI